jgi:hypothetical protein
MVATATGGEAVFEARSWRRRRRREESGGVSDDRDVGTVRKLGPTDDGESAGVQVWAGTRWDE